MSNLSPLSVMLVDDEPNILQSFKMILHANGISSIICCEDSRQVVPLLSENKVSLILLDLSMPHVTGKELLQIISNQYPDIPVIIVTGVNELQTAVDCMQAGAYDYIVKPPDEERLISSVRRAIETSQLRQENQALKERMLSEKLRHPECFNEIVTHSPQMISRFRYIEAVATTGEPVLITGETGVGKELVARVVHALSRPDGPFVAVNAAGLDDNAFSDTLFGHKKGAFTSAHERRDGLIKGASGGTLFLDEIGDLGPSSQVKLLRLLQEHEYFPLGSDLPLLSDARIVAATNRNLEELVEADKFRMDLYYRFRTHQADIPPLRERIEDLPLLVDHFLEKSASGLDKKKPTPPSELLALLSTYDFPGNVRELEAMVFDAVSNHDSGILSMSVFKSHIARRNQGKSLAASPAISGDTPFASLKILPSLKEVSDLLVDEALLRSKDNQSLAAQLLGISQPALSQRLKKRDNR